MAQFKFYFFKNGEVLFSCTKSLFGYPEANQFAEEFIKDSGYDDYNYDEI